MSAERAVYIGAQKAARGGLGDRFTAKIEADAVGGFREAKVMTGAATVPRHFCYFW